MLLRGRAIGSLARAWRPAIHYVQRVPRRGISNEELSLVTGRQHEELGRMKFIWKGYSWTLWGYWALSASIIAKVLLDGEIQEKKIEILEKHMEASKKQNSCGEDDQDDGDLYEIIVSDSLDPDQKMGDSSMTKVSAADFAVSEEANAKGLIALLDGNAEAAVQQLTISVLKNPLAASTFVNRGSAYLKLKKPISAIRDADAALQISQDCAEAFHIRGMAHTLLGNWGEAVLDLRQAMALFHEDEILSVVTKIDLGGGNAREQIRSLDWLRQEKCNKLSECQKMCRVVEAKARKLDKIASSSSAGFPLVVRIIEDESLMKALKDKNVILAIRDVRNYPGAYGRYVTDQTVGPVLAKVKAYIDAE